MQGHVDGTGELLSLEALGDDNWWLKVRVPAGAGPLPGLQGFGRHRRHQPHHRRAASGVLAVTIIPHTFRNTTLGHHRPGARVNLECDILAKHVEKLLRRLQTEGTVERGGQAAGDGLLRRFAEETLTRSPGHYRDWIRASKDGEAACSNFAVAGPFVQWMLLGVIAMKFRLTV